MTAQVIGLDLSLTGTGVALPDGSSLTITSRHRGVERLAELRDTVARLVLAGCDLVAIEGYSMGTARQSSHAHGLGELGGVIRLQLHDLDIRYVDIPPASLKRYATGKGNANKNDMLLAAARRLGYDGNSNDEADALWLRAMTLDACATPIVELPVANREALSKITWPEVAAA